jgi:hypothetical protein
MKFILITTCIFFAISATAQNCNSESLLQTSGTLTADAPAGGRGLKAADLARHKEVLSNIKNMIKSTYSPKGVKAIFHENFGSASLTWQPNGYSYSIIPLNYYCDNNAVKTAHETSTYFSINTNTFDAEIYDTAQGDRLLAEGFNVIDDMPVQKEGYWYFKEKDAGLGFGMTGKSTGWLITHNGKLPFDYVTKREFLEKRKLAMMNQKLQSSSGFMDVLANNEISKKYKEAEYKTDPEKLKQYLKMDYQPIKERYEKLIADTENEFKVAFAKIETQLKMPANELSSQAIVKVDSGDHLSYLFTDENDPFGKILIKPNPGYFNKEVARSSPQFFWIQVTGNHKEPIATKFMTDIVKAVDFAALKMMLDK